VVTHFAYKTSRFIRRGNLGKSHFKHAARGSDSDSKNNLNFALYEYRTEQRNRNINMATRMNSMLVTNIIYTMAFLVIYGFILNILLLQCR
jgi:hypothetical protein